MAAGLSLVKKVVEQQKGAEFAARMPRWMISPYITKRLILIGSSRNLVLLWYSIRFLLRHVDSLAASLQNLLTFLQTCLAFVPLWRGWRMGRGRHHPRGGLRHAAPAAADVGADPSIGDDAEGHGEASWKTGHPKLGR